MAAVHQAGAGFRAVGASAGMLGRLGGRTGARLAVVQAILVTAAFALAGGVTAVSITLIGRHEVRERVLGEVASLNDEIAQHGAAHLPHTVAKRSRLWRGFEYRLSDPGGAFLAGGLSPAPEGMGWSTVSEQAAQGAAGGVHHTLVFTERLADGSILSVGQNLSVEARQRAAVVRTLILCGALGVGFCLIVSYLFTRGVWRRITAVADAAHQVSAGRLDVRVKTRSGEPRDDIDALGLAFNAMLDRIAALVGQVRQVSTDIAHDLRTPLTRVRQRLERLKRSALDTPDIREAVDRIDADLEELLRTFDAMLRLAEIENADESPGGQRVDVAEIAARVVEAFRPDIEESGRRLDARIEPVSIRGDGQLISQAIANLLDNALRHTPQGTPIELGVERRPDCAALFVVDRGLGVPAEERSAVLQRFRRLDPSRSGAGSGLGLAIVAAIAKRHGAVLDLTDAAPGLKVELRFPDAAAPSAAAQA